LPWGSVLHAALSDALEKEYRSLRRDFFLVMPLSAYRDGVLRKEVSGYASRLNAFIKSTEQVAPEYQAAAYYFRGRLQFKLKKLAQARKDLERCLAALQATSTRAPGTPEGADIRVYRAFSFVEEGHGKVLAELEAIPADAGKPSYHEVGSLVTEWADALADAGSEDLALRAYELVRKYDLWHEEADDPQRKIDRIKFRLGQAGQGTAPAAAAAPPGPP
jgi:tetratricopeptide (TPR) repeat protein